MTIFQLLLYSCVLTNGMDGKLLSKMCEWRPAGFYRIEGKCGVDGSQQHGKTIHEFAIVIGATPRRIEDHRCATITVD